MNKKPIISVYSVSKTYSLYQSHRDRMKEIIHPLRKKYHSKYNALKNISLTVDTGEVLGVIGQNGSGKSTLLKILSSVVTPSSGTFECNGRISALLELGGGFDMDLTGLENVYFLGAIQGYSKKEMKPKIDSILDFAEIGEYIYQPVKSYSSGMYVRLAFSMNINIEPEILIIDEALAVGDIRFQQKCFRKIREIKDSGKTIVLCSHSLAVIKDFCTKAIWIHNGEIVEEGDPQLVTDKYQLFMSQKDAVGSDQVLGKTVKKTFADILLLPEFKNLKWIDVDKFQAKGSMKAQIQYATLIDVQTNQSINVLKGGEKISVLLIIHAFEKLNNAGIQMILNGQFGAEVININSRHYPSQINITPDDYTSVAIEFMFPKISNGNYSMSLAVTEVIDGILVYSHWVHDVLMISVENPDPRYATGALTIVENARVFNL